MLFFSFIYLKENLENYFYVEKQPNILYDSRVLKVFKSLALFSFDFLEFLFKKYLRNVL